MTKVAYFIVTIPLIVGICAGIIASIEYRYPWTAGYRVTDYYRGGLYAVGALLGYIIITDLLRRIVTYIDRGSFDGAFSYARVLTQYGLLMIIVGAIGIGFATKGSEDLRKQCSGGNEEFNDYGVCECSDGYVRGGWICRIINEIEEKNFHVDSTGWKEESRNWWWDEENKKMARIRVKVSPEDREKWFKEGEITELIDGKFKGEQLFTWNRAMIETKKANKTIPNIEWWSKITEKYVDIPLSWSRNWSDGSIYGQWSVGYYWSSTKNWMYAYGKYFGSDGGNFLKNGAERTNGLSVRCIKTSK